MEEAQRATVITVLGGYYSRDSLVSLRLNVPARPAERRRKCRIRMALGCEATASLLHIWEDLRVVDERLREAGFRDVEVSIVPNDPIHFHTKVFGCVNGTWPS